MNSKLRTLLLSAAATTGLLALAACSSPAAGDSVVGTWGDPDAAEKPSLTFEVGSSEDDTTLDAEAVKAEAAGEYHGTDGCNQLGGSWAADGDDIDLGAMRSTMMFCEGVDTWLSQASTAKLSGDKLTILDESGKEIGTLDRAAE
ncbi:MAG: META domain-containing protein [Leucobacter sp.]